jgi:hypothetical protein
MVEIDQRLLEAVIQLILSESMDRSLIPYFWLQRQRLLFYLLCHSSELQQGSFYSYHLLQYLV